MSEPRKKWIPRRQYRQEQRAQEMGVEQPYYFSPKHAKAIKLQFGRTCFKCKAYGGRLKLHIDHHRPLSKGFPLVLGNAVCLCRSCNLSKGTKMPEDFYTPEELITLEEMLAEQKRFTI